MAPSSVRLFVVAALASLSSFLAPCAAINLRTGRLPVNSTGRPPPTVAAIGVGHAAALAGATVGTVAHAQEPSQAVLNAAAALANGTDAAATAAIVRTRPPRVYFLFLAVDKVSNLGVWQAFFAAADPSKYRAFIHCKLPSCLAQVAGTVLEAVPTVPSYYCTDLVSPMNQLLAVALSKEMGITNPADKFAFVSDSTLPAKPFAQLYVTLTSRQGSDFCIFPSNEWADVQKIGGGLELAAKHHQWVTLDRGHAEKASVLWAGGKMHDFMARFGMNTLAYTWSNNTYADNRNFGCLDEFWHMAALYGTLKPINVHQTQFVRLPLFTGAPLQVSASIGWQGACDTFVVWSKYLHAAGNNPFERLHSMLDAPSIPHGGNAARPGWWDTISNMGLLAIRNSDFLFVRKFIDNPRLADGGSFADAYIRLVLT